MQGHRRRGGLLQRLVGEQPARHVAQPAQLVGGAAAQQRRLDQQRCPVAELRTGAGDICDARRIRELKLGDRGKRRETRPGSQVTDVVDAEAQPAGTEAQEGLTPVTITL